MNWSGLVNFVIGFVLAIALLVGGGTVTVRYLIDRLTAPPPKPVFPNDKPIRTSTAPSSPKPAKSTPSSPQASPAPSPSPTPKPSLDPGTYPARVTQSIGLILRDSPNGDATQVGGVEYNQRVIILEESPDKQWQRVRVEGGDREGWVKAGNTERLN